jgi:hypothetical protein
MTTYTGFHLISIDAEQRAKTCGYWYLIQTYGCTPHTAFRSKAALLLWLGERGLEPTAHIPDPGEHSVQQLKGSYRTCYVGANDFRKLDGVQTVVLSNARYVDAVITHDPDGIRTVHVAHYDGAPEYNHRRYDDHYHGAWAQ